MPATSTDNNLKNLEIYDTTLRDGAQSQDVSFSVEDKLRITLKLDELGVHYIEGGWPGANPKDTEYFKTCRKLKLDHARIAAFGSTHRAGLTVEDDPGIRALVEAGTTVITIFGKSWDLHVNEALKISLEANLEIIHNTIRFLKQQAEKVFYDAEHFFDGFKANPEYALKTVEAAVQGGADNIVLCDTNGGTLPGELGRIIGGIRKRFTTPLGIHAHNDSDCAVANSLLAVESGVSQIQGTINGIGERCGNANLISIIPNLVLKQNLHSIPTDNVKNIREVSRFVSELANQRPFSRQPFVGDSAFAHKAGVHVSAIQKNARTYEHIEPQQVGNVQRVLISDLSGKSNILRKAGEFGVQLKPDSPQLKEIVNRLKQLENQGYEYGGAEASFELVMRKILGQYIKYFNLISYKVSSELLENNGTYSEAIVRMEVGGKEEHTVAIGNGPVNALDNALRKALYNNYPELHDVGLVDYKVRVLATGEGTTAVVRVLIESTDGRKKWSTVGVSENIIEASWQALVDSIEYKLLQDQGF